MENYSDQSHTVHVGLGVHKDSIAVVVGLYTSHTSAVEVIDYGSVANCNAEISRLVAQIQQRGYESRYTLWLNTDSRCVRWQRITMRLRY